MQNKNVTCQARNGLLTQSVNKYIIADVIISLSSVIVCEQLQISQI